MVVVELTNGVIPKTILRLMRRHSAYAVLQIGTTIVGMLAGMLEIRRSRGEIEILTEGQIEITIGHDTMVDIIDLDVCPHIASGTG